MQHTVSIWQVFLLILVILGGWTPAVQAQAVIEIDRIVIQAPRREKTAASGQESIEITEKTLSHHSVSDVVERVAGVHVLRYGSQEQVTGISLRGSASSQVTVFFDDIPLGNASSEGITLNLIRAADLSRIEIYKSFSPSEYGAQAIGGVVSLKPGVVTKGQKLKATVAAGSFHTIQSFVGWQFGTEKNDVTLGFSHHRTEGDFKFEDNNGTPLNPADDRRVKRQNNAQQLVNPHLRWRHRFANHVELTVAQHFFRLHHGVPGLENFQSLTANRSLMEWLGQLTLKSDPSKTKRLHWKNTLYHRLIKSQFSDPLGEIGLGVAQDNDNLTLVLGERISVPYSITEYLRVMPQFEYVFEHFVPKDYLSASPTGSSSTRHQINFSVESHAGFWRDRLQLDGVLWSGHALYSINNNDPSLVAAGTFFSNRAEHPVTATLALRYRLWDKLFLKGSLGRSVRLPQFQELFGDQGYVLGNPQLSSEKNVKFDLGLSWQKDFDFWLRSGRAEITYFENHVEDLIQFELANGLARAGNLGKARVRGIEAVSSLSVMDLFQFSQNYTWQMPRDLMRAVGGNLVGRPEHEANFTFDFEKGPVSVSTHFNFIDRQYLDRLNTRVIRNRWRWDASAAWRIKKEIILGLELKNLIGTQIVDAVGFPLPGRSIMGSVSVQL